jgi:hypothetical protein
MKCSSRFIPEKSKYEKIKSDKCFNWLKGGWIWQKKKQKRTQLKMMR